MPYVPPVYYDSTAVYNLMDSATSEVESTLASSNVRNPSGQTFRAFAELDFLFREMQAVWMTLGSIPGQEALITGRFSSQIDDFVSNSPIPLTRWAPTSNGGQGRFTQLKNWATTQVGGGDFTYFSVRVLAEVGERIAKQLDGEVGTDNGTWTADTYALISTLPII